MKPLLTIGIPTYNRSRHLNERLTDLEKMGYLNHPHVQIIIHDNDSKEKDHCRRVEKLQKTIKNLLLIENSTNVGMVKACHNMIAKAKGEWIIFLGDDDPIILKCANLLSLIRKNRECDHLFFEPKINENDKISPIQWVPKLKVGIYKPAFICAKQGFTTGFAYLGAHCFRNKEQMAEIWIKSHTQCMFYGHCVMFLRNYRKSFYTGKTVAAWTPGNERINKQQNLLRHLEVANLLKDSGCRKIKQFIRLKPWEVVKQGIFSLMNHVTHPVIDAINQFSFLKDGKSIKLKEIKILAFNSSGVIQIFPPKKSLSSKTSCIFGKRTFAYPDNIALNFQCGPKARLYDILKIIAFLDLSGPIYLKNKKISFSQLYLASAGLDQFSRTKTLLFFLFSVVCFGPENFNTEKILRNALSRPRKGLYRIILEIEKRPRLALKRVLGKRAYYQTKQILFGRKHFRRPLRTPKDYPLVYQ
jgi:glycosyltransferase involved in cell wall biosynthesis